MKINCQNIDKIMGIVKQGIKVSTDEWPVQGISDPSRMVKEASIDYIDNQRRPVGRNGLYLRVCNKKIIFLFLDQNICCVYSKEPSQ